MEQEDVMNRPTRARRRVISAALTCGLGASLMLGVSTSLAGEANGNASCMGIELSAISPPGSSDELPGGGPEFVVAVGSLAASLGLPPGGIDRLIAHTHAGSHDACDAEG
jgi:hypothetical protein